MHKAALPIGILLVGGGAVLLFIAFHNVPANVTNLPELLTWMFAKAEGKGGKSAVQTPPSDGGGGGFQIPPLPFPLGGPVPFQIT